MPEPSVLRFLELVSHELQCADCRAEIGGRDPESDCVVWARAPSGHRIVALFDAPPENPKEIGEKLQTLIDAFFDPRRSRQPGPHARATAVAATRRLDDALASLAERAQGVAGIVIDVQSPVIWGTSLPRQGDETVDGAIAAVQGGRIADGSTEPADLVARAIHALRGPGSEASPENPLPVPELKQPGFSYLARSFAGIYLLALVFDAPFSELQAEGALLHALPHIEHLVMAIPPVDPPPEGGKENRIRHLKPV